MKERITITIDKELLNWVDSRVEEKIFSNRSHALEFLMKNLKVKDERTNNCNFG